MATPQDPLFTAAVNAAATLGAFYEWCDRVAKCGGPTCLSGIAECDAMIKSMEKSRTRVKTLVLEPLNAAIEARKNPVPIASGVPFDGRKS